MDDTITLQKESVIALVDSLMPGIDDPGDPNNPFGPYGPAGPVISRILSVLLNPQPLPPRDSRLDHWRLALLARTFIDQLMSSLQVAEVVVGTDQAEKKLEPIRQRVRDFVDEYCGTRPGRWPLPSPWPPKLGPDDASPIGLVVAGVQFQKVADAMETNVLKNDFSGAADKLIETGLKRMISERRT